MYIYTVYIYIHTLYIYVLVHVYICMCTYILSILYCISLFRMSLGCDNLTLSSIEVCGVEPLALSGSLKKVVSGVINKDKETSAVV